MHLNSYRILGADVVDYYRVFDIALAHLQSATLPCEAHCFVN